MSGVCYEVPPKRRRDLITTAEELRAGLRIDTPYFPILEVIEFGLPSIWPEFTFSLGEMDEMGDDHGLTFPDDHEIRLRADVYEGVREGKGRDRFTLAHELGHLLLHSGVAMARNMRAASEVPPYRSSEWQANSFAGALLVPISAAKQARTAQSVAELCGVTLQAAEVQLRVLRKENLI